MKILYTFLILFAAGVLSAQTPSGIHYQAALRDARGAVLANEDVTIKVTVRTTSGPAYKETITTRTNDFGIINVVIGEHGMPNELKNKDWASGNGEIELSIESSKGTVNLGTKSFQSVPYSFYSDKAGSVINDKVNDADADPNNEIQMLSYNITTRELTLSKGNSVVLPASSGGDDWGNQKVVSGATLSGDGTAGNPLEVVGDLTDDQQLNVTGSNLSITGGNTIALPDADPANELQNLSFAPATNMLSISDGNTVDLTSLKGSGSNLWQQTPIGIYALKDVYVNHTDSVPALHLSPTAIDFHVPFPDKTSVWSPEGLWFEHGHKMAYYNVDSIAFKGFGFRSKMNKSEVVVEGAGIDTYTRNAQDSLGFRSQISGFNNGETVQDPFGFKANGLTGEGELTSEKLHFKSGMKYVNLDKSSLAFGENGLGVYSRLYGNGYGLLTLANGGNWTAVSAKASSGAGELLLNDLSGRRNIYLGFRSSTRKSDGMMLLYHNQKATVYLTPSDAGGGFVGAYGPNGHANVVLREYHQGTSSGVLVHPNNGSLLVCDVNGTPQGGIYVNSTGKGVIWGDIKSFSVPHPNKKGVDIWYASLEGPEVAAYDRGTAKLVNGEATIPFSEHYKAISNTETMTVLLTPHSIDTYGLAVVKKTKDGFVVKELKGAKGNFSFDWEVKCKRKGREHFEVERPRSERSFGIPEEK